MSFNWTEYYNYADQILNGTAATVSREAIERCAISRAYYAAFCIARNYVCDKKKELPNKKSKTIHQDVINRFKIDPVPTGGDVTRRRSIGKNLRILRTYRNKADYDNTVSGLAGIATTSILTADSIIQDLGHNP